MKKTEFLSMVAGICALLFGNVALAGEDFTRFSVGLMAAYYNTAASEINDVDASFDTVPVIGLSGEVYINRSFSVEIGAHYIKTDLGVEYDDNSEDLGEIEQTPIFLTVKYQHPIDKVKANVYLGLGANYFFNDFSDESGQDLSDFFGANVIVKDIKDSLGWHANVGTEWFFMKQLSAYLDLKVIFNEAEVDLVYPDSSRETKDLAINASVLGMGVKYYFF